MQRVRTDMDTYPAEIKAAVFLAQPLLSREQASTFHYLQNVNA